MTGAPLTPSAETPLDWRDVPFFFPVIPAGVNPMARAREHPYIWATWLARLLAGESSLRVGRMVPGPLPGLGETTQSTSTPPGG